MALLKDSIDLNNLEAFSRGVAETVIEQNEFFNVVDFVSANGGVSHSYTREGDLPTIDFVSSYETIAESHGVDYPVTVPIKQAIGDVDIDSYLLDLTGDSVDFAARQIAKKSKAASLKLQQTMLNGANATATLPTGSGAPASFITSMDVSNATPGGYGVIHLKPTGNELRWKAPMDDDFGDAVTYNASGSTTVYLKSKNKERWIKLIVAGGNEGANEVQITVMVAPNKEFPGFFNLVAPTQIIYAGANSSDSTSAAVLSWERLDELRDLVKSSGAGFYVAAPRTIRSYKTLLRAAGGTDSAMLQLESFNGQRMLTLEGDPMLKAEAMPLDIGPANTSTAMFYARSGDEGVQGVHGADEPIRVVEIGELENKSAYRWRIKLYATQICNSSLALAQLGNISN